MAASKKKGGGGGKKKYVISEILTLYVIRLKLRT